MKRFTLIYTLLGALFLGMVGCDTKEPTTPVNPDEQPCFEFKINKVTKASVAFTVTPLAKDMPYLLLVIDKASFDGYGDEYDCIDADLLYLQLYADNQGKTIKEILPDFLMKGVVSNSFEGLSPDTDYYIYAYHMNTDGEVVSDLEKIAFKTEAYNFNEDTYDVAVSGVDYTSATVSVSPSNTSAIYFMNVLSDEDYNLFGGTDKAFVNQLEALRNYYLNFGKTPEEMIANLGFVGARSLKFDDLSSGAHYYAYAMSVDEEFMACSEVTVVEFTTRSAISSANTFSVEVDGIFYDHIEGRVVPSNSDTYLCAIQPAESLEWFDNNESVFMDFLMDEFSRWPEGIDGALRSGTVELAELDGLTPATDYIVACFGWEGAPTTDLFIYEFTTAEANDNPDELVVEFNVVELSHSEMKVDCIPSVGAYYFCSIVEKAKVDSYAATEGGEGAAIRRIANEELDYGAEYFECTRLEYLVDLVASVGKERLFFNNLTPNTDYVLYAVAVDMTTGALASQNYSLLGVKTIEKIVGDARVTFSFGDYYDGSALAELDAAQFNGCRGMAVVPYSVEPNEDAQTWYTKYDSGDYTSWDCSDDMIVYMLVTYGANEGDATVSVNRRSGVAVLPYDELYTFIGIAKDSEDNYGVGTLQVVEFSKDGVSPAEEFIASLDKSLKLTPATKSQQQLPKARIGRHKEPVGLFLQKPHDAYKHAEKKAEQHSSQRREHHFIVR